MRLANKIGIVTGAASGMGRAGAIRFASEGARVAVVDRDEAHAQAVADEIEAAGGAAVAIAGELSSEGFSRAIVDRRSLGSAVSIFCGIISAIRDRRRSRIWNSPISTARSISTCARC